MVPTPDLHDLQVLQYFQPSSLILLKESLDFSLDAIFLKEQYRFRQRKERVSSAATWGVNWQEKLTRIACQDRSLGQ